MAPKLYYIWRRNGSTSVVRAGMGWPGWMDSASIILEKRNTLKTHFTKFCQPIWIQVSSFQKLLCFAVYDDGSSSNAHACTENSDDSLYRQVCTYKWNSAIASVGEPNTRSCQLRAQRPNNFHYSATCTLSLCAVLLWKNAEVWYGLPFQRCCCHTVAETFPIFICWLSKFLAVGSAIICVGRG